MDLLLRTLTLVGLLGATSAARQQSFEIPDLQSCARCAIEVEGGVALQSAGLGAVIQDPLDIEVDSLGRFWVLFPGSPVMVYGKSGEFLRTVGRIGEGPGEYPGAYRVVPSREAVAVFSSRGSGTVFGLDFEYVRRVQLSTRVHEISVLQWPTSVLLNGRINTPESVGFPLHVVDVSSNVAGISRSIGIDTQGELRPGQLDELRKRLWRATDGIWSADRLLYRVAKWDERGELDAIFLRNPEWFRGASSGLPGMHNRPPEPSINAVSGDSEGRLWVFSRFPSADWRQRWEETENRYGRIQEGATEVSPEMVPAPWHLWSTMIEVIDPDAKRVVVRQLLDAFVIDTLADGRVVTYTESEDDFSPDLRILALRVVSIDEQENPRRIGDGGGDARGR